MTHVWLAQCPCGPNRHAIAGLADEFDSEADAIGILGTQVGELIAAMRHSKTVNPWCAICGSPFEKWHVEVGRSRFATVAEAQPELEKSQARNLLANILFGTHGPDRPKRQ